MKIVEGKLRRLIHDLLLQEQEAEKKKVKMPKFLGKALQVLNPNKNKKIKDVDMEDEKEVEKATGDKETVDNLKKPTSDDGDVLAFEQFALNLLKDKNYTMIIDNNKFGLADFMGMLFALKTAIPDKFSKFLENKNIKQCFEKYKSEYSHLEIEVTQKPSGSKPASTKSSGGGKTSQIKFIQKAIGTKDDGDWGKNTDAKWEEWIVSDDVTKAIEKIIGTSDSSQSSGESANESMNRSQLRNLLETMAYFPYLNEEPDAMVNPDEGGSEEKGPEFTVKAYYEGENIKIAVRYGKKLFTALVDPAAPLSAGEIGALIDKDNKFKTKVDNAYGREGINKRSTYDKIRPLIIKKGEEAVKKAKQEGKPETDKQSKNPQKPSAKKSTPKSDNMGRQGKMGEIAKNRGNAGAIAKMLGFEGTLAGVAKAVEKIKDNMPKQVSENRKLFNTLRKYKII